RGDRCELARLAPVQHEHGELVGLGAGRTYAGNHDLAQFQVGGPDGNVLQVVRVVVLAVDEDDLLRPSGDVELAVIKQAQVPGSQPAIRGERGRIQCRLLEITAGHVGT